MLSVKDASLLIKIEEDPICTLCDKITIKCVTTCPLGSAFTTYYPFCEMEMNILPCDILGLHDQQVVSSGDLFKAGLWFCRAAPPSGGITLDSGQMIGPGLLERKIYCPFCHENIHVGQCREDIVSDYNCMEAQASRAGHACLLNHQQIPFTGAARDPWPPAQCDELCYGLAVTSGQVAFNACRCGPGKKSCDECEKACVTAMTKGLPCGAGFPSTRSAVSDCKAAREEYCR